MRLDETSLLVTARAGSLQMLGQRQRGSTPRLKSSLFDKYGMLAYYCDQMSSFDEVTES